jgi:shikimate kinase
MNIVLTGFMGTGKTAVGRRLAEDLHVPFVDMDKAIEKKAGEPVAAIFERRGEAAFRALEREVAAELVQADRTVIATGGGALLNPENRAVLAKNGILVCLNAKMGTLLDRLKDDITRPLLAGENVAERMERLMKERETIYSSCPVQVATDGKTIAEVAAEIIAAVRPQWGA